MEDRLEFCELSKHAPSLSPALGKTSLLLLQQLWCMSSPCFMAPISMLSGEASTLQSCKRSHPGFRKIAKE